MGKYTDQIAALEQPTPAAPAAGVPVAPKSKYADQIAALSAPQGAQNAPQEAFGGQLADFYAPGATAARAAEGAAGSVPFVNSARMAVGGQNPYSATPEGVGQAAGDIGGTAAAIASGGLLPLAKFVGLGAGLNALGVPQAAHALASKIEEPAESIQVPSKVAGIEGLGTLLNFLGRTPAAVAGTAIEAAPYALAGKAIGVGEPIAKAIGEQPAAPPAAPPTPGQLLQQHGGELSPAMRAGGRVTGAVTSGIEKLAGMNPLTAALPEGIQAKNVAAVQNYLEKNLGSDVANLSARDFSDNLEGTIKDVKTGAVAKMKAAEAKLQELNPTLPEPTGMTASRGIQSILQKAGVPYGQEGFDPAKPFTGNEAIPESQARGLMALDKQVQNAKTIPDLLAQRRNIDAGESPAGTPDFGGDVKAKSRFLLKARQAVNDALNQAIESSGNPEATAAWAEANQGYGDIKPVLSKAARAQAPDLNDTDALTRLITSPTTGTQMLERLKRSSTPDQWNQVQDTAVNAILDRSRGEGGVINSGKLGTAMTKTLGHVFAQLDPEKQQILTTAKQMMDTAQIADLKKANPSGSGVETGKVVHTASLFNPLAWGPLAAETAGIGGYYGVGKAIPAAAEALANVRARAGAMARTPIPGTGQIPPYLAQMLKGALSRPQFAR